MHLHSTCKKIVFLLSSFIFFSSSFSQQVYFKKMFPDELLINPSSIAQDIKGNIWITSQGQLTKYDGYSITRYRSGGIGSSSFAGNILVRVYADKSGIIWIGTIDAGLQRLDPSTNIFTQYKHDAKDNNSISNDFVTAMLEDKDGNFWVGTQGGLNKLDRETGKIYTLLYIKLMMKQV
jgi:ligand-binding sensor domain-containing protein